MSSSNTCDFSLHSHSTSNCKCSSSSPYYSHLTQTRPIISFYFSKTVPVLQFLIFATVLTYFAKRVFIVTLPVLRVLCCSRVAVVSGWLRSSLFEHVLSHWKLPVGTVYNKNVKMIVTILQDLSRSI